MFQSSPALLKCTRHENEARRLLQCAQGAFQKWPEGFAGFAATIRCREKGRDLEGEVRVLPAGHVELRLAEEALADWATRTLRAMSLARTPRFFKDGDGRYPISFAPDDQHPLGRAVTVHLEDGAWRTYRIDAKGRIRQEETANAAGRVTTTYDEFVRTCPGRVLPTRSQVLIWDVWDQRLVETVDVEEAYERREYVWLPVRRRTTLSHVGREIVLELAGHILL